IAFATALSVAHAHGAEAPTDSSVLLPRCPDDEAARRIAADPVLRSPQGQENDQWQGEWGTFNLDRERRLTLGGGVVLRRGERELATDTLTLRDEGRRVDVEGGLTYRDPELIVSGESGIVEGEEASFEGARFELPQKPARGGADRMAVSSGGVLTLSGVQYTTGPEGKPDWQILADRVTLDPARGTGVARDARVEFFGVPLLRLPAISFPVGNARKSGLLF